MILPSETPKKIKCVLKRLTGSQLLLGNDTKASRDIWKIFQKTNVVQLFEPINQIQGTDLDFFLRLFPLGAGVGERQGQNRAGGGEGGVKRRSDCNSESRTPDCSGDWVLKKQSEHRPWSQGNITLAAWRDSWADARNHTHQRRCSREPHEGFRSQQPKPQLDPQMD